MSLLKDINILLSSERIFQYPAAPAFIPDFIYPKEGLVGPQSVGSKLQTGE
jgi:hypothetical protein